MVAIQVLNKSRERNAVERPVGHFPVNLAEEVYEKGRLRARFLIDPDRGYICPKGQLFEPESGDLYQEIVAENFFLDEHSQKWFPEKAVNSSLMKETQTKREFRLTPNTLILNQPIPDSVFSLTVEKNTRVDDTRRNDMDTTTFFANQEGKLDLSTAENKSLDEIPWLSPIQNLKKPQ